MKDDDVLYLPAYRLRQMFLNKELSPVDVVRMSLQRAEYAQKKSNCLTQIFDKRALIEAKIAEENYLRNQARPLEGIPLLIKSEAALKGSRQDFGSKLYKNYRDEYTDIHIQRLLDAGAIPVAKTTTPEFSSICFTYSDLRGVTTNPWHEYFSPGGSSGGSAAGLAWGIAPLATGSDIGGSIRIPAAWSGVVGFKAPYGRVPQMGPWGMDYYCHIGPMARSNKDIAMMMDVMAGIDFRDPASVNEKVDYTIPEVISLQNINIAMVIDWGKNYKIEKEVADNMREVAKVYQSLGATVTEIDVPLPKDFSYLALVHTAHVSGAGIGAMVRDKRKVKLISKYIHEWGLFHHATTAHEYFRGEAMTSIIAQKLAGVFSQYHAILTPMTTRVGVKSDFQQNNLNITDLRIIRKKFQNEEKLFISSLFNNQSRCPVVAMPSGFANINSNNLAGIAAGRMPTGVQLVGRPFHDAEILKIATAYEQTQHWYADDANRPL